MSAYLRRVLLLLKLELRGALEYRRVRMRLVSLLTLPVRWFAVVVGRRTTTWFGCRLTYESRFEPVLMQANQLMADEVASLVGFRPGDRVLDIGANVGQFAVALLVLDPGCVIHSFEPNPEPFEVLARNAAAVANWHIHPFGVSDRAGGRAFWFVPGRSAQGSVHAENAARDMIGSAERQRVERLVEFVTAGGITELAPGNEGWRLVKVDVEGHEREVLGEVAQLDFDYLLVEIGRERAGSIDMEHVIGLLERPGCDVTVVRRFGGHGSANMDVLIRRSCTR